MGVPLAVVVSHSRLSTDARLRPLAAQSVRCHLHGRHRLAAEPWRTPRTTKSNKVEQINIIIMNIKKVNLWPYALTMTAVFVIFKLYGVIDWSWWLVLLPLFAVIALLVFSLLVLIASLLVLLRKDAKKIQESVREDVTADPSLKEKMEELQRKLDEQIKNRQQ